MGIKVDLALEKVCHAKIVLKSSQNVELNEKLYGIKLLVKGSQAQIIDSLTQEYNIGIVNVQLGGLNQDIIDLSNFI